MFKQLSFTSCITSCTVKILKLHNSPDDGRSEPKHVVSVMIRLQ